MISVRIEGISYDEETQMAVVILIDDAGNRVVPIWVGLFEAQAILFKMKDMAFPRPLTHDLMKNLLATFGAKLEYVLITEINEGTFYAELHLKDNGKELLIDSRPSDAIALALRAGAPIYVSDKVYAGSFEKEQFLDKQRQELYRIFLEYADEETFKQKH